MFYFVSPFFLEITTVSNNIFIIKFFAPYLKKKKKVLHWEEGREFQWLAV